MAFSPERKRCGFALIIVVALLALLIMVLVSLATLTRIEAGIGANSRVQAQARQNARFALDLAIGEVQRHAGPDQRTTARAELTGAVTHPYWTGVWSGATLQSWLVSANENRAAGNPDAVPTLEVSGFATNMTVETEVSVGNVPAVTLVGPRTAGAASVAGYVAAPRIDITGEAPDGTTDAVLGRYAWWVGDEGVKARINMVDPFSLASADSPEGRARHLVAQRGAPEAMTGFSAIPINATELPRVLANSQMSFLASGAPSPAAVRNRFHDLTTHATGVLSDASAGGLRRDLSAYFANGDVASLDPMGAPFSTRVVASGVSMAYVRSWADLGVGLSGLSAEATATAFSAGTQHGVHPVIVRHSHFFGASYEGSQLRVHYLPVIALWNPYDIGIAAADYVIEIAMPFAFEFSGTGVTGVQPSVGTLWFVVQDLDFQPGECRLLSASSASPWSAYATPGTSVTNELAPGWRPSCAFYFGFGSGAVNPTPPTDVALIQTGPSGGGAVRLRLGSEPGSPVLQEISGNGSFPGYSLQSRPPASVSESSSVSPPALMMYDAMVAHGWGLVPASGDNWVSLAHEGGAAGDWAQEETFGSRGRGYTGFSWTRPSGLGDPTAGQTRNILWNIPRANDVPLISLAELHQVRLPAATWTPRHLFDPGSGAVTNSALWDGYFMSGLASSLSQANIDDPAYLPFFNRLRFIRRSGVPPARENVVYVPAAAVSKPVDTCASAVVVDGMFNLNSVSAETWRAVLSVFVGVPVSWGPAGSVDAETGHPFTRSSFPGASSLAEADLQNSAAAWAGFRRLSETQISALATYFAAHVDDAFVSIKNEGEPFASLADFVRSTIIEDAIADASINSPTWTNVGGLPDGVEIPGVFTKWDLLARLLPVLAVRSDTFVIRAYGDVVNATLDPDGLGPETGPVSARAWCEAVVQRMPDFVDTSLDPWLTPPTGSSNEKFGRRFVITSFRWLSPDDI